MGRSELERKWGLRSARGRRRGKFDFKQRPVRTRGLTKKEKGPEIRPIAVVRAVVFQTAACGVRLTKEEKGPEIRPIAVVRALLLQTAAWGLLVTKAEKGHEIHPLAVARALSFQAPACRLRPPT